MYEQKIACRNCKKELALGMHYSCPECDGILEIQYDYEKMCNDRLIMDDKKHTGMWKYSRMLPIKNEENIITLGEGMTSLLRCKKLEHGYNIPVELYIKTEHLNPSGSFKDRPSSVGVSVAKEYGAKKIVIASSGNASAAAAAYCACAGIECIVFIPENTDISKITQVAAYGATVIPVKGNYSNSYKMALECSKNFGFANVTSTFLNPYTVEANKTVAYEIWEQLGQCMPDYVIIPIASGPLLVGMYKGFKELKNLGIAPSNSKIPIMIGVQSEQCMPITRAYQENENEVRTWEHPISTIAGGISDPLIGYEHDGTLTLKTSIESGGLMTFLTEDEILTATRLIETKMGIYCEPTSATAVGAVNKLFLDKTIPAGSKVVSIITGHGFKYSGRKPIIEQTISCINDLDFLKDSI